VVDGSFTYAAFTSLLTPMNQKDGDNELYLPADTSVVIKYTEATKIFTPYGITPAPDNIRYKKDGILYPFPSYIDSLQYFDDRIEVLDSDDSGVVFVEPLNSYWSTVQEMEQVFGDTEYHKYIAGGFAFFNNHSTHASDVYTGASQYGDQLTSRVGATYSSSEMSIVGASTNVSSSLAMSSCATYSVESPAEYSNLYITADVEMSDIFIDGVQIENDAISTYTYHVEVRAITITNTNYGAVDIAGLKFRYDMAGNGDKNYFPTEVDNDLNNVRFRYENESHFGVSPSMVLGYGVDLLSAFGFSEVDLRSPIKFIYSVTFEWDGRLTPTTDRTYSAKVPKMRIAIASKEDYSVDDLYVVNASNENSITSVADSYIDTCSRQNLTSLGFDAPAIGWGLELPSGDITEAVNTADITSNAPAVELVYSTNKTGTKQVKYDLLRYGNGIGHVDSLGLESWADISTMYVGGVEITPYDITGVPSVKTIDTNKVYTDIGVTHADGNIDIRNTEQGVYDSSYVEGVDSDNDKKALWFSGNLLYQKYNVKNEYPKVLANCRGVVDAVEYIKRQYAVNGIVTGIRDGEVYADMRKRFTISFTVPTEFAIENSLWIGKGITPILPSFGSGGTGIITGLSRSLKDGNVTITAEVVGDIIATTTSFVIIESGIQTDSIVESGTQDITYKETING